MKKVFTKAWSGLKIVWKFLAYHVSVPLSLVYLSVFIMLFSVITLAQYSERRDDDLQRLHSYYRERLNESIDDVRAQLVEGLFTADSTAARLALTEQDRITIYMREAKGFVLQHHGADSMDDSTINEMLLLNYEYARRFGFHPGLFLAFASVESSFNANAVSSAGARGIVQFMPYTAAITMGDDYFDGIEFNPIRSVSMWYRYTTYFLNHFNGDIEWLAASYLSPHAVRWYERGESVDDFLNWVASWSENPPTYASRIMERFDRVRMRIYEAYLLD